ncbi:hypothetical protein AURDEDRAFT_176788 [Auricularia subglabra TFB-10046 SS5]|uniref:Uncharacterized protein n=1 Tax=Auricularia subglabra (strain TFB-10046 / SS5) TaxID=717982 RepID=J0LCD6_AURST|nr:hypothetical protein AURDEDRAFT_176788 [Auricularia subglabra TFB-10046 SS5]
MSSAIHAYAATSDTAHGRTLYVLLVRPADAGSVRGLLGMVGFECVAGPNDLRRRNQRAILVSANMATQAGTHEPIVSKWGVYMQHEIIIVQTYLAMKSVGDAADGEHSSVSGRRGRGGGHAHVSNHGLRKWLEEELSQTSPPQAASITTYEAAGRTITEVVATPSISTSYERIARYAETIDDDSDDMPDLVYPSDTDSEVSSDDDMPPLIDDDLPPLIGDYSDSESGDDMMAVIDPSDRELDDIMSLMEVNDWEDEF